MVVEGVDGVVRKSASVRDGEKRPQLDTYTHHTTYTHTHTYIYICRIHLSSPLNTNTTDTNTFTFFHRRHQFLFRIPPSAIRYPPSLSIQAKSGTES